MPSLNPCPRKPGDVADDYLLRRLPAKEAQFFKRHLRVCSKCRAKVERARDFISAIRGCVAMNVAEQCTGLAAPVELPMIDV